MCDNIPPIDNVLSEIGMNYNMDRNQLTKQQAIEAMNQGYKVKHRFFDSFEWISMVDDKKIITEEGYICTAKDFWDFRKSIAWETDWGLWIEPLSNF